MQHSPVRLVDYDSMQHATPLDPASSLATIIAHAQHLAAEASVRDPLATTSSHFVRKVIDARAARRQFFGSNLFADPAWDILLELYVLRREQRRTSVSKLCIAAEVPGTTASRWLDRLNTDGLIERQNDPLDARRVWVSLSTTGLALMESYLAGLSSASMPI